MTTSSKLSKPVQHTPGPYSYGWDRDGCNDHWYIFPASDPQTILATIDFWDCEEQEMQQTGANARLFAAAPELLDGLKGLLCAIQHLPVTVLPGSFYEHLSRARDIVARAEGRV